MAFFELLRAENHIFQKQSKNLKLSINCPWYAYEILRISLNLLIIYRNSSTISVSGAKTGISAEMEVWLAVAVGEA